MSENQVDLSEYGLSIYSRVVQTVNGPVEVRWDQGSPSTPMGQLAYFIEFINLTGLWDRWLTGCPLNYTSPNASSKEEVLGTWMLSVLAGHRRYAHVTAMRCDGVNPGLLGMRKVISEDALRNALKSIDEKTGKTWLSEHLNDSTIWLLDTPWILDTDTTIKPLYGKQEGAEVSCNPKKPGRPSQAYHTYLMAGLRLVLGVDVCAGKQHTAHHAQPGLLSIIDALPPERKPGLVRGDCAFGNDSLMNELESRKQEYLFKLKLTKNVKRFIARVLNKPGWQDAGQGWEGQEGELQLQGWKQKRRVIVLRRSVAYEDVAEYECEGEQMVLQFPKSKGKNTDNSGYEYAVLVTNTDYEIYGSVCQKVVWCVGNNIWDTT